MPDHFIVSSLMVPSWLRSKRVGRLRVGMDIGERDLDQRCGTGSGSLHAFNDIRPTGAATPVTQAWPFISNLVPGHR
jgi:hypothetical protein